jgi:apolipoprotein N-acyltransferase
MNLSPLIKGIITAVAMIAFNLTAFYTLPAGSKLHFLLFGIYATGIIWTLIGYRNSPSFTGKFGDSFNSAFKCFIVATLIMIVYTFIFNKSHPEFARDSAKLYKEEQLRQKDNSKTPDEIEAATVRYEKGYTMAVVYGSIFGYLLIGAAVAAFASLIITKRK